jgi:RHS repeat-associated protein
LKAKRVSGTITQNLRLPGQYFDVESGWNHNGFRDYAPQLGRYIEPDPLGRLGSGNDLYAYVYDNPTNLIDPLGLCPTGKIVSESSLAGMFLCGIGGTVGQLANVLGGTWGVGLGGSAGMGEGLLGIGGEGGLEIVADPQGNVGILATGGVALAPVTGVVVGAGALGGGQVSVSFTNSIYNLTGAGWDAGFSAADELGFGGDISKGLEPGSPVTITLTGGFGLGGKGGLTSFTGTKMLVSTNCKGVWGW